MFHRLIHSLINSVSHIDTMPRALVRLLSVDSAESPINPVAAEASGDLDVISDDAVTEQLGRESFDAAEADTSAALQQTMEVVESDDDFAGNQVLENIDLTTVAAEKLARHQALHAFEAFRHGKFDEILQSVESVEHFKSPHTGRTTTLFQGLPGEYHNM
jgi:hypothetical protein